MRVLVINTRARYNILCQRIAAEGNTVYSYTPEVDQQKLYTNYAKKHDFVFVDKFPADIDLVILTELKYARVADALRRKGIPVFGASEAATKIELDRGIGKRLMRAIGIDIPESFTGKVKDAIEYVQRHKQSYVVKPHENLPTFKTYVPYNYEDSLVSLYNLQRERGVNYPVTVERYIDGIEVGVETFFNGEDFLRPVNISFEHKKSEEEDSGTLIGESGTTMYWEFENEDLFLATLARAKSFLVETGYRGDVAIGLMYSPQEDRLYGLEWTCFDDQTEVLTDDGWVSYDKLTLDHLVYALNMRTGASELKPIKNIFKREYDGYMISIEGKDICLHVTPEHKLIVNNGNGLEFKRAADIVDGDRIVACGRWKYVPAGVTSYDVAQKFKIKRYNYKGMIWDIEVADLHTVFVRRNGKSAFTSNCRIGMPEFLIQLSNMDDITHAIYRIASGDASFLYLDIDDVFLNGVWYYLAGHPFVKGQDLQAITGFPVHNLDPEDNYIYPVSVEWMPEFNKYITTNTEVLVATGAGSTMREAIAQSYERIREIQVMHGYFRQDIGSAIWQKSIPTLYNAGYVSYDKYVRSVL